MTAEQAAERVCPIARTFGGTLQNTCRGPSCPIWRWHTGPSWRAAVTAVAREIGDTASFAKSAAVVAEDPAKHGCEGYCGLGGAV